MLGVVKVLYNAFWHPAIKQRWQDGLCHPTGNNFCLMDTRAGRSCARQGRVVGGYARGGAVFLGRERAEDETWKVR